MEMTGQFCTKCKQGSGYFNQLVICRQCRRSYHLNCLSPSRNHLRDMSNYTFIINCDECLIQLRIEALENEVTILRREIKEVEQKQTCKINETTAHEIYNRIKRSCNVIVHNLAESTLPTKEERFDDDKDRIAKEILLFCNVDVSNIHIERLGNTVSHNPRPLRVTLNRVIDAVQVLAQKGNCKSGLTFRVDKTYLQRQQLRQAMEQLHNLRCQGFPNYRIKYHNGVPQIVQMDGNVRTEMQQDQAAALMPKIPAQLHDEQFEEISRDILRLTMH